MKKLLLLVGAVAVLLFVWGIIYTRPSQYTPPASWAKQPSDSLNNYHPGAVHDSTRRLGLK